MRQSEYSVLWSSKNYVLGFIILVFFAISLFTLPQDRSVLLFTVGLQQTKTFGTSQAESVVDILLKAECVSALDFFQFLVFGCLVLSLRRIVATVSLLDLVELAPSLQVANPAL
jgi:bacteriorhodopsin